jgi:hypothetical protein
MPRKTKNEGIKVMVRAINESILKRKGIVSVG